jgi:O-antigen/teichoic acid export membrane protein
MRRHLTNAVYGVIDYASYPIGMLLVAPIVLHRIGASEYGLWMVSTAVVSTGGIIASGFCDANIQRVARFRGTGQIQPMVHTVRSQFGINLVLGSALAALTWVFAPYAAQHIAVSRMVSTAECLTALRIASLLILVRAVETVAVSTQRAFEEYRSSVQVSAAVRLLTLASAAALAFFAQRTVSILAATAVVMMLGTLLQFQQARRLLGGASLWPAFEPEATRALLKFGAFVWFQALGGVIFTQFDRILLGVSLGAQAVAPYALCVQFAQPITGVTASGLSFLFPYLSKNAETMSPKTLRHSLYKAVAANLAGVGCCAGALLLVGHRLLRIWAGVAIAESAVKILPLVVLGSALMGISATGIYALQALGQFRIVSIISLGSRAALLPVMVYLLHKMGLEGLAISRVCLGSVALLVHLPLWKFIAPRTGASQSSAAPEASFALQEGPHL